MLEVRKLSRSYDGFVAVDDVTFNIGKGEIVGLLGHNGAGKTTIMKMLSGYLEPDQGQITIDGTDLSVDPKKVQQCLGYLPENLPIYPEMSVADYLDYAADLKGLSNDLKRAEIKRVIEATDLGVKLVDPIGTLSRGYKQRVGVAQAILGKPKLLILDEATTGLDPTQTEHMRELIRDIAKEATVILSTHIMQEVDALCDRVLILSRGCLAIDARLDELRQSNRLLITTSMPEDKAMVLLSINGLEHLEAIDDTAGRRVEVPAMPRYRLTVTGTSMVTPVSAVIAREIIHEGFELYGLQSEHRDLETLFREVSDAHGVPSRTGNEQREVSHAA
ncbi:MAG: ABC transporter ATP-binding protein [Gammaproteobacteria bacterium]|nr:ABC transporter ATP-binding protein [Gammaproteobacteria bacterium]